MSALAEGLSCLRCGGQLRGAEDPQRLHCAYCETSHLMVSGDDVAAFAPRRRIGRRRAHKALSETLKSHGVGGLSVEDARLAWLPFWHVQAKLVGWQVYRQLIEQKRTTTTAEGAEIPSPTLRHEERQEELVARDVDVTLPGCDAREWGLVGIADRLRAVDLRPFAHEREADRALVCSVVVPRAAALHQAEAMRIAGVAPRRATHLKQRLSLARVRTRLIYYPVWKLQVTVDGVPAEVDVDGARATVIRGSVTRDVPSRAVAWWAGAASSGWLAGVHPALGALGLGAWCVDRLHRSGSASRAGLGRWLSEELAPVRSRRIDLDG